MRRKFSEPRPLSSERDIRAWWSSQPRTQSDLRICLTKRLIEKVTVGEPQWPNKTSSSSAMDHGSGAPPTTEWRESPEHKSSRGDGSSSALGDQSRGNQQEGEDKEPEPQEIQSARALIKERMMLEGVQVNETQCQSAIPDIVSRLINRS